MYCSSCGTKLEDGVKFCSNCGAKVAVVEDASEIKAETKVEAKVEHKEEKILDKSPNNNTNSNGKKNKMIGIVVGVIVLVIIIPLLLSVFGVIDFLGNSKKSEVAAINENDKNGDTQNNAQAYNAKEDNTVDLKTKVQNAEDNIEWFDYDIRTEETIYDWNIIDSIKYGILPIYIYEGDNYTQKCILIDKEGNKLSDNSYHYVEKFHDGISVVCQEFIEDGQSNYKYGCIDAKAREIVPCKYDYADYFSEGLCVVAQNEKYGYINKEGVEIIPLKYDTLSHMKEGRGAFGKTLLEGSYFYGYLDEQGNEVIEAQFKYADSFSEGLAYVTKEDENGNERGYYIDKSGEIVIELPPEIVYGGYFSHGLASVSKVIDEDEDTIYGYIDKTGELVIPFKFYWAGAFDEDGYTDVMVEYNGEEYKMGIINTDGDEVIKAKYDYIGELTDGILLVGIINPEDYVDTEYTDGGELEEGGEGDEYNFIYGFADVNGNIISDCKYDYANDFSDGLAAVYDEDKEKYGYINTKGEMAIPIKYPYRVTNFYNGIAGVLVNEDNADYDFGGWGFIDDKGNVLSKNEYDYISSEIIDGIVLVQKDNKYGIINFQ